MIDTIEEKRQSLVKRVNTLLLKHPRSYMQLAREIGIDRNTLIGFMKGKKATSIKAMYMIEKFLEARE